jgi:hypothetical protein
MIAITGRRWRLGAKGTETTQNGSKSRGIGNSARLFPGDCEERQIHVHDEAQEYGNAADDRGPRRGGVDEARSA